MGAGTNPRDHAHIASSEVLALAGVARQYADHGRTEDALKLLEGLLVLEPANSYVRTALGCVYLRLAREAEALDEFEAALRLDPRDAAAHTYAGELRLRRGEQALGLSHLDAAVALDPDGRNPYSNRARTLRIVTPAGPCAAAAPATRG
jgi:tetratricopeptide (TPR) repeat protein